MEENTQPKIQANRIPVFTVLKNGSILKNIFLLSSRSSRDQESDEEILLVGRHPHCNISLEHPSISRFHLRIHSKPSTQKLLVIDLSSVHGTWVSGKRIEPGVPVKLKEGDTVRMGGSSRIYELHWVPMSQAYDVEDPFVPAVYTLKDGEETTHQDENCPCLEKFDTQLSDADLDDAVSNKIHHSSLKKPDTLTTSALNHLDSSSDTEVEQKSPLGTNIQKGEIFCNVSVPVPLIVSGTISATEDSNGLSKSENRSRDNGMAGGKEVDVSGEYDLLNHETKNDDPVSASNEKEILNSETTKGNAIDERGECEPLSHQKIESGSLYVATFDGETGAKKSESDLLNHGGTKKDDPVSASNENDALNSETARGNAIDKSGGYEPPSHQKIENGSLHVAVLEGETVAEVRDISDELDRLNRGTKKDDPVSASNERGALNSVTARDNAIDKSSECEPLSPQEIENGSIYVAVLDGETRAEKGDFSPNIVRSKEVDISSEFEQMNRSFFKGADSKVDEEELSTGDKEVDMGIKDKSLDQDTMKNKEVFVAFGDANHKYQEWTFTPDISRANEVQISNVFKQQEGSLHVAVLGGETRAEKGDTSDEFDLLNHGIKKDDPVSASNERDALNSETASDNAINKSSDCGPLSQQEIENGSVYVTVLDGATTVEKGDFTPDIARSKEVNIGSEFEQMNQNVFHGVDSKTDEEELCTGDKEVTMSIKYKSPDRETTKNEEVSVSFWDGNHKDQEWTFTPDISRAKKLHMSNMFKQQDEEAMKNFAVSMAVSDCLDTNELEIFTPDKENINPNASRLKSMKKRGEEDEYKHSNHCTFSLKKVVSFTFNEEENIPFSQIIFTNGDENKDGFARDGEKSISIGSPDRSAININAPEGIEYSKSFIGRKEVVFSPNSEAESRLVKTEGSCNCINYPQAIGKNFSRGSKKRWTMVVDTNSLLHNKSLKHLKFLQGLRGTQLVIPSIVMKKLINMKGQKNLLRKRTAEVSSALKWIEECMVKTRWWIYVENLLEEEIPNASTSVHEPKVLENALHLRRAMKDQRVIILSNDLTLKIKAMAQGVRCETAEEFHKSLVSPFSERFMWVGSSARGLTWSCVDDAVLGGKYCRRPLSMSHGSKGLKLLAFNTFPVTSSS